MKYFSMFTGIGGFEVGIEAAYRQTVIRGLDENKTAVQSGTSGRPDLPDGRDSGNTISASGQQCEGKSIDTGSGPACVGYSEINRFAAQVYARHYPHHKNYGDATKINTAELPDFDLLVGGFPCQPFSSAGKHHGFNDTRGTLFFEIARILTDKRPRHFLLENVKGLLSHDGGKTFQTILKVLSDVGYRVEWCLLNSKDHGVPQNRERIFIIGHLRGECTRQVFPLGCDDSEDKTTGGQEPNRKSWISTLDSRYGQRRSTETYVRTARIRRLTPVECERLQGFPDGWTEKGIDEKGNEMAISDTQRYKMCGNAVTTNVIRDIMKTFLSVK